MIKQTLAGFALVAALAVAGCRRGLSHLATDAVPAAVNGPSSHLAASNHSSGTSAGDAAISGLYGHLDWMFLISILVIFVGVVLGVWVQRRLGFTIAALGGLGLALAAAAIFFLKTLAITGLVIILSSVVAAIAVAVWHLVRLSREHRNLLDTVKDGVVVKIDPVTEVATYTQPTNPETQGDGA